MAQGLPYDSDAGPGLGGRHHRPDDRSRLCHLGPHRGPDGTLRRLPRQRRGDAQRAAHAPRRGGPIDEEAGAARAAVGGPGVLGRRGGARRAVRRAQLAGQRAGPDGDHRPAHGLRHHRGRARPRAGQDQEAGRRGHHVDRQPDRPAGPDPSSGYCRDQVDEIIAYIDAHKSIVGAPYLAQSTWPCSPARWGTTPSTTRATSA